jgi:acetylornithine deacetylase/succinyl-diaminopimelate desuccinylase-like protein
VRLEGRTPVLFFEVPATKAGSTQTVLMYGHLDKQPEFTGWRSDLGPWTPKYEDGKLYGRGGADDGYAVYASIAALQALKAQGKPHPRIVGLIETCEESGSYDLLPYIDALRPRLGDVALVICLDSGAGNYDQLWLTTSLRGLAGGTLKVQVLTEGVHSGDASGLVPSSFRIMRQVLDRLEDSKTGRLLPASFHCEVPADRLEQARATAAILGDEVYKRFPWAHADCGGSTAFALPTTTDPLQALVNRTWTPTLSVTGAEGFPALQDAGNVLRPYTAFKLSLRLPPLVDAAAAVQELKTLLEDNAPYQARVTFEPNGAASGWNAPASTPWFENALNAASLAHFGAPVGYIGQGGTIPLMNMLSQGFPRAQMMVCGVLGPRSNAHGPNEFLHVPYAKRLTAAVAEVMAQMP